MMMQEKGKEVTVFGNNHLRNTWENRVNQYQKKETSENERRQKSALPQLFDQWHQRWECRNGIPLAPEKKSKGQEISEFRKVLELEPEEVEKSESVVIQPRPRPPPIVKTPLIPPLPKIPPPRKLDPEARKASSTPKPQPKLEPPPKREEITLRKVPKPEPRQKETIKTEREKVLLSSIADKSSRTPTPQPPKKAQQKPPKKEVEKVQQKPSLIDWNQSWKYARPHQKTKHAKTQDIQFMSNRKKSNNFTQSINIETPSISEWIESWKFLNNPFNQPKKHNLMPEEFSSSLFFELEQEKTCQTEWAESWKILNIELHQENTSWGNSWSQFCRDFQSNKLENWQSNEQALLLGWEESWKSLKPELHHEKRNVSDGGSNELLDLQPMEMENPMLKWSNAWKLTSALGYDDKLSLTEWHESWKSCAIQDKCTHSLDSHHSDVIYMPKNFTSNKFNSQSTDEEISLSEWSESWMFPKPQENKRECELNEDIADPELLTQSEETSFSKWKKSWIFSNANDEAASQSVWRNSWKLTFFESHEQVMDFSEEDINTSHQLKHFQPHQYKCSLPEWNESTEKLFVPEWNESWKAIKHQSQQETEPEESSHLQLKSNSHLSDWHGSWRLSVSQVHPDSTPPSDSSDSCRLLNLEPPKKQEFRSDTKAFKQLLKGHFHMGEPSISEWSGSWKFLKSGSPDLQINNENMSETEWGASWKFVNPPCNLEAVPWSQQDVCQFTEDSQTKDKLSILSRGERSSKCFDDQLQLCLTEWNESWKSLKTLSQEQQEAKSK